eukprot:m.354182 g.354182  ORF g.354182 m.354182 type:complete len:158 (+) comp16947_c0_seq1:104-577(+)
MASSCFAVARATLGRVAVAQTRSLVSTTRGNVLATAANVGAVQKRTWFGFGKAVPDNEPFRQPWYQVSADDDLTAFEEPVEQRKARIAIQKEYYDLVDAGTQNPDVVLAPKAVNFAITFKDRVYAWALYENADTLQLTEEQRTNLKKYLDAEATFEI